MQGLRWTRCLVYLDNIILFGSSVSDALDNLQLTLIVERSYGLQLKSTKSHLFQTSYGTRSWDISSVDVGWSATP